MTTVSHGLQTYLAGQPRRLAHEFDVTLVTSPDNATARISAEERVPVVEVEMTRRISPVRDLRAVYRLYRLFRRIRPHIVQTYSPKAGLLGMWAAWLSRVPVRVHGIIGMPLMATSGARRTVLCAVERLTYLAATDITCNSFGLRAWTTTHVAARDIAVVAHGSINGVDLERIRPPTDGERDAARAVLGLRPDDVAFTFIGRIVSDKGVAELLEAFEIVRVRDRRARLIVVGAVDDARDAGSARQLEREIASALSVIRVGWSAAVEAVYYASDVVVLPSHREGLPNVLLEAAAAGLPSVASDISGCREVVQDGINGRLVPVRDPDALAEAMVDLLSSDRRAALGRAARAIVETRYEHRRFVASLARYYHGLLDSQVARTGGSR